MRFCKFLFLICFLISVFSACKKNSDSINTNPSFYFLNGDTSGLSRTLLLFGSSDTLNYDIVISSTYIMPSNALVTVAPADEFRTTYNTNSGASYQAMPSNAYTLRDTITAAVSSVYDTISVKVYRNQLPAGQYMLPIKIVSAGGNMIDDNTSVIYLYTTSNILAGLYSSFISRVNYNGDASAKDTSSADTLTISKGIIPDAGATTSEVDYADLGSNGWKYILSPSAGNPDSLLASPNSVILNSVQSGSFKILSSTFNPATKKIYLKSSYKNSTGDERIIEESLTLQK